MGTGFGIISVKTLPGSPPICAHPGSSSSKVFSVLVSFVLQKSEAAEGADEVSLEAHVPKFA